MPLQLSLTAYITVVKFNMDPKYTSHDIQRALFPKGVPQRRTIDEMKEGIRQRISERFACQLSGTLTGKVRPPRVS